MNETNACPCLSILLHCKNGRTSNQTKQHRTLSAGCRGTCRSRSALELRSLGGGRRRYLIRESQALESILCLQVAIPLLPEVKAEFQASILLLAPVYSDNFLVACIFCWSHLSKVTLAVTASFLHKVPHRELVKARRALTVKRPAAEARYGVQTQRKVANCNSTELDTLQITAAFRYSSTA